jgi:hypothetical protein
MMLFAACAVPAPPIEPAVDLSAVAARYLSLVQDLARHDPSLVDHWLTEPPAPAAARRPVFTIGRDIDALLDESERAVLVTTGATRVRATHIQSQLKALSLAARRLLGESLPFDAEAALGLGVNAERADLEQVLRARDALDAELPGAGALAERVSAFRRRFVVPDARRETVMRLALDQCRAATAEAMPLPADESIDLALVAGLPWDAHARYLGRHQTRIEVNADRPLDLARALHLACHEGYAGHHAQYIWTADELVTARGWREYALVPGFGPKLALAEGAAEAGASLAMPYERRVAVYRDHLAPAAGLRTTDVDRLARVEVHLTAIEQMIGDIARDYLDNQIHTSDAIGRLSQEALVADPEGFVMFIERRRTRVLAYSAGRRAVLHALADRRLAGMRDLLLGPLEPRDQGQ